MYCAVRRGSGSRDVLSFSDGYVPWADSPSSDGHLAWERIVGVLHAICAHLPAMMKWRSFSMRSLVAPSMIAGAVITNVDFSQPK